MSFKRTGKVERGNEFHDEVFDFCFNELLTRRATVRPEAGVTLTEESFSFKLYSVLGVITESFVFCVWELGRLSVRPSFHGLRSASPELVGCWRMDGVVGRLPFW